MSECPGCAKEIGDLKICRDCYRRLPDDIRRALYYLFGEEHQKALEKAEQWLRERGNAA
jgi:hypothetical protein